MVFFKLFAAVAAAMIFSSCTNREAGRIMDSAEDVMWTRPDSALAALESVDTLSFKTKAQRARYSLLYTMALNRNWIDTTDLSVIQPAARYYERHGSKDDKMKMYYYLGTVQHNAGDLENAIGSYIRAKEYSSNSDNMTFRGLINSGISDIYAQNHNYYESISYSKEASECFTQANDSFRLWNTTGCLADYYLNIEDWPKADSLNALFFSQPVRDSSVYSRQLFNVAWGNFFRPDSDPRKSIDLFIKATMEYGGHPSYRDYCVYAGALEAIGNHSTADGIIRQLEGTGMDSTVIKVWKYRILKHRGDYKNALSFLEQSVEERDSEVRKTVGQSVALAQSDYYENKSLLLDRERHIQSLVKWMVSLVCLLLLLIAIIVYLNRRRSWKNQIEEMSSINDAINRRLSETLMYNEESQKSIDSLTLANELAEKRIESLSGELSAAKKGAVVMSLRRKYVQAYKQQYNQLNDLCHQYWNASASSRGVKDMIYAEVKKVLAILDEPNQRKLESMLDDNLDGIMTRMRVAMPDMTDKDCRFLALLILGFDSKTIARMMDYNVNTVYTKRYKFKEKISRLDSVDKEFFLEFIF